MAAACVKEGDGEDYRPEAIDLRPKKKSKRPDLPPSSITRLQIHFPHSHLPATLNRIPWYEELSEWVIPVYPHKSCV